LRAHGGSAFLDIDDGSGKVQVLAKRDVLDADLFDLFLETVDVGDFVSATGTLFVTKRGEQTLEATTVAIIVKSLRPLPEKWHGLKDTEERFRRRYLDTLMNKEVRERFRIRSTLISSLRRFLDEAGFMEVETPVLQSVPGGTSALPFATHHNALDIPLYLRVAPELFLKRLLVGGFSRVYEIGRNFRNEGIDHTHNPEFTMLEYYRAYSDSTTERAFVETLIRSLAQSVLGTTEISYKGETISLATPFLVRDYYGLIAEYTGIQNPADASFETLCTRAYELGITTAKGESRETLLDALYKKACRPQVIQPTFVIDYPADALPLAKRHADRKNLVDAFQLIIGGVELVKAFSELNDPLDQEERFIEQERRREAGDKEAQQNDPDFLESLEYGMPPAGGVGIGIDRLAMLFTDTENIKEVILFPTMRPRGEETESEEEEN
jgi:lysyl-tRNA synthetase class 2